MVPQTPLADCPDALLVLKAVHAQMDARAPAAPQKVPGNESQRTRASSFTARLLRGRPFVRTFRHRPARVRAGTGFVSSRATRGNPKRPPRKANPRPPVRQPGFCDDVAGLPNRRSRICLARRALRVAPVALEETNPVPARTLAGRCRKVRTKGRPRSRRAVKELARVRWLSFPGTFCGAAGARASICACTAFNTRSASGQSASGVCGTTAASQERSDGIQ